MATCHAPLMPPRQSYRFCPAPCQIFRRVIAVDADVFAVSDYFSTYAPAAFDFFRAVS